MARRLKTNASSIYKWENQLARPGWHHLVACLELNQFSIESSIFQKTGISDYKDPEEVLRHFSKNRDVDDVCESMGVTRQTLNSFSTGRQSPKAESLLKLWMVSSPQTLVFFLDQAVGIENLPCLNRINKLWKDEALISLKYPFTPGIIELSRRGLPRKTAVKKISTLFSINEQTAQSALNELSNSQIIGLENDTYLLKRKTLFDSSFNYQVFRSLNRYWTKRSLESFTEIEEEYLQQNSRFSYLVMSVSESTYSEIFKELTLFYSKVRELTMKDHKRPETTRVLTLQLVNLEEPLPPPSELQFNI